MYIPVVLPQQLSITHVVTAFDEVRPKGYFFSGEMHDFWEMAYVMEGAITVTADDRVYTLSRGQMIFHQPMEFHSLRCAGGKPARVLVISFAALGEGMKPFCRRVMELDFDEEAQLLELVGILNSFLANRLPAQGAHGRALLEAFLWKLSDKPLHTVERHTAGDGKLYETGDARAQRSLPGGAQSFRYCAAVQDQREQPEKNVCRLFTHRCDALL